MNELELQPSDKPHEIGKAEMQPQRKRKTQGGPSIFRKLIFLIAGLALLVVGSYLLRPIKPEIPGRGGMEKKDRIAPVTVAQATTESVPVEIRSIGNVLPFSVVNVVPQVSGQLKKVFFTQGQFVKKGDALFQIDPQQYEATLQQALGNAARDAAQIQQAEANMKKDEAQVGQLEANLKRDQELARYAHVEVERYNTLVSQGAVSKEQADQIRTNLSTALATVEADKKAIENAQSVVAADKAAIATARGTKQADEGVVQTNRIQLGWTVIRSPIAGKTSSLQVYEGNVVTANNTTPLVTIAQVEPIYVNFTVPEQYLSAVNESLQKNTLKVEAKIEGSKTNLVVGKVSFLENSVNTATGTVTMRAAFANADHRLFPGQFVDVVVSMPPEGISVVVPITALQTTQQGSAVYVLNGDKADFRPVKVARTHGDFAALSQGLSKGETVITDGQLQLTPGAKVKVVSDFGQLSEGRRHRKNGGESGSFDGSRGANENYPSDASLGGNTPPGETPSSPPGAASSNQSEDNTGFGGGGRRHHRHRHDGDADPKGSGQGE